LPAAKREIFQVAFFAAHAQADEDDDREIDDENERIDGEAGIHAALGDKELCQRKDDFFAQPIYFLLRPLMKLWEIPAGEFNLEKTLNSGQVFHWEKHDDGFVGTIGDLAIYLEQDGSVLKVRFGGTPKPSRETRALPGIVARYFSLDHPLKEICASFPNDPAMNAAREFCRGLRIIRQPKWECLATFICSSMKQVVHIRQISMALRRRFGTAKAVCGREIFSFPSAERIAATTENELKNCGLGYRAKNLLATAKRVASGVADLEGWSKLPDSELRGHLMELPGVGAKVANCVMLFAYERTVAFPIDVWIERVLRQTYFARRRKVTAKELALFATEYFGVHAGYAQQYLFHHARLSKRRTKHAGARG
jgi:N-glycosylase/DNA lyase